VERRQKIRKVYTALAIAYSMPVPRLVFGDHGEGVGTALRKCEDDLRLAFNEAIAKIRADGTYQAINQKYFDFDVYGPTS